MNFFFERSQGKIEIQGTPADIHDSDIDFSDLIDAIETPENRETKEIVHRQKSERLHRRSSLFTSKDFSEIIKMTQDSEKDIGLQMEASSKGTIKGSLTYHYFKAGVHWSVFMVLVFFFLITQLLASAVDYWVSIW